MAKSEQEKDDERVDKAYGMMNMAKKNESPAVAKNTPYYPSLHLRGKQVGPFSKAKLGSTKLCCIQVKVIGMHESADGESSVDLDILKLGEA